MKAFDVMQRQVIVATPDMSIEDAVHLMLAHRVSGLPVLDPAGSVVGILSEGDLLRRVELGTARTTSVWQSWLVGQGREARNYALSHARKVGEAMTASVIFVTPETPLSQVVSLMESHRIKRVPVLENGRLVGILTRSDLVRALERLLSKVDTQPAADAELRRRILDSLKAQRWTPNSLDVKVEHGVAELIGIVTDEAERKAARVLAETTPGIRGVIDHLLWIESLSGFPLDPLPWNPFPT
jgi:CBS domain-containing protein